MNLLVLFLYHIWQYKAFIIIIIIEHYSKQSVSLKGKGEKYNMSECVCYPLYHQIPFEHSHCSS